MRFAVIREILTHHIQLQEYSALINFPASEVNNTLDSYKINFFVRSQPQNTDDFLMASFNLSAFMSKNQICCASARDFSSNEAYLCTKGRYQAITALYLYFRKIYFPSNPKICYGEKF